MIYTRSSLSLLRYKIYENIKTSSNNNFVDNAVPDDFKMLKKNKLKRLQNIKNLRLRSVGFENKNPSGSCGGRSSEHDG